VGTKSNNHPIHLDINTIAHHLFLYNMNYIPC